MTKIKDRLRNWDRLLTGRLANKLIFILLPTVSVFIILLILISYFRTTEALTKDFIENNKSILKLIGQNFNSYIEQVDEFSLTLRKDEGERLMRLLLAEDYDYDSESYIQERIKNMFYARQDIDALRFYIPSSGYTAYISRTVANLRVERNVYLKDQLWYREAVKKKSYRYMEPVPVMPENGDYPNGQSIFFTFHRALINIPDQRPLGVVSISFNYALMNKMVRSEYLQNGEILCIFQEDNRPFYVSPGSPVGTKELEGLMDGTSGEGATGSFKARIGKKDYLVVYGISDNGGWKTAKLIPLSMISEKVRETRNISLLLGIVFIIAFAALIMFISNVITGSLRRLSKQMDKVGGGNFKVKAEVRGSDEIALLAERFNTMVARIDELVNEKYMAEINEKTARLKALEAQINPHFLYNSLQAIASRAVVSGMKDIGKMIEAMAFNLRYCIKGGEMVRVSNEIEHIENYLTLHKARFEDRLSVEIHVEDGTPDIEIPKLSIHTLVENAVKHCLEVMTGAILIKIHTYTEDNNVIIRVSDDGPGMAPERLAQVRSELDAAGWPGKQNESIGLKNLNARLKLLYGDKASLLIDSVLNRGTEIRIVLPSEENIEYG